MKRLTQYNLEIKNVIIDIDAMLTQLEVLKSEVIDKLGLYTVITKNSMLEKYDHCDETSLTTIPEVMGTFNRLFAEFKMELFRIKHKYNRKPEKDVAIAEIQTLISMLLTNIHTFDNSLRIITNIQYEDYIKMDDEDMRRRLWGGRRSKGWCRKTKRRRNNKTKRRRTKSMR